MKHSTLGKILFIMPEIAIGGAEVNVLNVANSLENKFEEIEILYFRNSDSDFKNKFSEKIKFTGLDNKGAKFLYKTYRDYFSEIKAAYVVTSSFIHLLHLIVLKRLGKLASKIIYKVETNIKADLKASGTLIDRVLFYIFGNFCIKNSDLVITSSLKLKEILSNRYSGSQITHIYNPVVSDEDFLIESSVSHPFFNQDKNRQILISIGRLTRSKGFEELIEVLSRINRLGSHEYNFNLIIIGDGQLHHALDKLIEKLNLQNIVDIIPFNNRFLEYIKASDIFVSNSFYEGLNNNLIHALSQNIKIISTDCPFGPSEVLKNGELGRLVKVGDQKELIEAIIETAGEEPKFNLNRKLRAQDFLIERNASKFLKLIMQL